MKLLKWVGSSYKDLIRFPDEVRRSMGYALHLAQIDERHAHTKVLSGMGSSKIVEIRENDESGTYRVVYTLEIQNYVFVLHAFQKKSKSGIATPSQDIEIINNRLKEARAYYNEIRKGVK
jgi:phage-related protein